MTTNNVWEKSYHHDVSATAQQIWRAWVDTAHWSLWNHGVKSIQIEGDFAAGSWFSMTLPDNHIIRSRLDDVCAEKYFTDVTRIDKTLVKVTHRIDLLHQQLCRITYTIHVVGSEAEAIGKSISEDFPEVLTELEKYLTRKTL